MEILPPEITRVVVIPVRCSMDQPPFDPRHQPIGEPASAPPIDLKKATPDSIAWAKRRAAEERAGVDAAVRAHVRRHAKAQLRELVANYGVLEVRTLLDEIEGE